MMSTWQISNWQVYTETYNRLVLMCYNSKRQNKIRVIFKRNAYNVKIMLTYTKRLEKFDILWMIHRHVQDLLTLIMS